MIKIHNFMLHNDLGEEVRAADLSAWAAKQDPWRAFNATKYSWHVNGEKLFREKKSYWVELPDSSGFICFEDYRSNDNCSLLDAYGENRCRLIVPVDLTGYEVPPQAERWFRDIGTYPGGQYGVTAWVERAGDFYFELDYREGRFLWGKEIRF